MNGKQDTASLSSDDIISAACERIGGLIKFYGIGPGDWPLMKRESPNIWERIEELEWLGPLSPELTHANCRALVLNYERAFLRRAVRKERRRAA
jgi:hypothetical protein